MITHAAKVAHLTRLGFTVGARDRRLNASFPGAFMVAEPYVANEVAIPRLDASAVHWCIVGDSLVQLVSEAYAIWEDE